MANRFIVILCMLCCLQSSKVMADSCDSALNGESGRHKTLATVHYQASPLPIGHAMQVAEAVV